jgi:predicted HTH domain antitoxin
MAMPEDMGRYLSPGELMPARDLLDPSLFCQADKLERDVEEDGNRIAQDMYEMRSLAVDLYREGRLSLDKAAELAGAGSKWKMLMLLSERGVPLAYTADDAKKDLQTLESVLGR